MITINFQENSSLGLTETIYISIKKQINQGLLKKNEKLPSKRALAQNLGVSVITVQNAYGQLISEGYIYSIEKKGFFVTELPMLQARKNSAEEHAFSGSSNNSWCKPGSDNLASANNSRGGTSLAGLTTTSQGGSSTATPTAPSPNSSLVTHSSPAQNPVFGLATNTADFSYETSSSNYTIISQQSPATPTTNSHYELSSAPQGPVSSSVAGKPAITSESSTTNSPHTPDSYALPKKPWFSDFKNNSISYEKFPFSLWSHTMRQVLNSGDEKLLQRSQAKGVVELRKELSRYLLDFRNMNVSPEQIVIGAGTENLYALIVQLLGRDKIYAVENPGYHKAEGVFRLNGVKTIPVNLDSQGIFPEELEKSGAQVLHFSPSHHFPSGIVMPVRRRQEILRWAFSSPDRYILEDDYDSEFRFNGKPLLTLQSADSENRVIYINTFSKTLAPSFRISYMVLPPDMLDYFEKKLGFYSCPVSSFEQYTLARFIQQGNFEKHIIRMKNYYRNLRNSLITAIQNSKLKEITKIQEKESGLHFLLTVTSEKSGQEIRENLEKNGINLPLIVEYYYGQAPQNLEKTFVVNYSGLKKEKIPETVRRLQFSFM